MTNYNISLLERYTDTFGVKVIPEYRFCPKRRFRADYALPYWRLLIEVDGGVWKNGRHNRGKGFLNDMEKYNLAAIEGWQVLRFTPKQFRDTQGINLIEQWRKNRLKQSIGNT